MSSRGGLAISARGLSKAYTIRHQHGDHVTLTEQAIARLRHPLRRSEREQFWALRDIDFDVRQGEVLGVIGRNGAGKSTLLKVLTRITSPTAGQVDLWGRVGSLLEVGTGFHPELTGRENVYLNGSILGMTGKEIDRQFDAIVEFAGVERFLDTPVKRYSSGMYVRLAFAVAAHLETEILLVDEVLAVGDAEFQKRCLGKMSDVAKAGRTVLFVSHQMSSIAQLCDRCLLLTDGTVQLLGGPTETIREYLRSAPPELAGAERTVDAPAYVRRMQPTKATFEPAEPKGFRFEVTARDDVVPGTWVSFHIVDESGQVVAQCDSRLTGLVFESPGGHAGELTLRTPWLKEGRYTVDSFVCNAAVLDAAEGICAFEVAPVSPYPETATPDATARADTLSDFDTSPVGDSP